MDEKKSYPYLRSLLKCGMGTAAVLSAIFAVITFLILQSSGEVALSLFFAKTFSSLLILVGAILSLGGLYASTIPSPVVAYKTSSPMLYLYSGKTGTGVRIFNKIVRSGTDAEPMACLFVAGIFMILEGVVVSVIWG